MNAVVFLRNANHIEAQQQLFRNIRQMERKMKGGSTSKLTTHINGELIEYTDKASIEIIFAFSNEKKYHVTEGGS